MISEAMARLVAAGLAAKYPQYEINVVRWTGTEFRYVAVAKNLSMPITHIVAKDAREVIRVLR